MKKNILLLMIIAVVFSGICIMMGRKVDEKNIFSKIEVGNKMIIDSSNFMKMEASLVHDIATDNQMNKCDIAIYGKIQKIEYLVYQDTPWTRLYIKCKKNFKGKIEKNETVTVYVMGGYLDKETFERGFDRFQKSIPDDALVEIKYLQKELSKTGDEGVFFLTANDEDSIFGEGTYCFLCSGYSKMMYDNESGNIEENTYRGTKNIARESYFAKLNKYKK